MRGFLFRDWLTSGVLAAGIVVGAMALSEPAYPQGSAHAKAPTLVQAKRGQVPCFKTEDIRAVLKQYNETQRSIAVTNNGDLTFEVYSTPDGKSWTVVTTNTEGISCVMAEGNYWMDVKQPVPGTES